VSEVPSRVASAIETALGRGIVSEVPITQPWWSATSTVRVIMDGGLDCILQWSDDRAPIGRRIRAAKHIAAHAPWIPAPVLVAWDASASVKFTATLTRPGRPGSERLVDSMTAIELGTWLGRLQRDLALLDPVGPRLDRTWADPSRLALATDRWLHRNAEVLSIKDVVAAARLPALILRATAGAEDTFAHGDFVPVNVLVTGHGLTGVVDFERARIAHQWFDVAWCRSTVRYHHPDIWRDFDDAVREAAGVPRDRDTDFMLDILAAVQALEVLNDSARHGPDRRSFAATRFATELRMCLGTPS
jgi:aminoglycoside phosphotransferase